MKNQNLTLIKEELNKCLFYLNKWISIVKNSILKLTKYAKNQRKVFQIQKYDKILKKQYPNRWSPLIMTAIFITFLLETKIKNYF